MARVDLAEDTLLGRPVALKRMAGPADDQGLSRLRREALAGASLSHPNLVSIYDVVTSEEGQLVVVMEYVAGGTLRAALNQRRRLPTEDALPVLEGVAAGLDAIHEWGIVHRDVKPSNILLGDDGAVKVADLGIAAIPDRTRITTAGSVLGSLSYMAPEQLDNSPSTPSIDVYALAAVAYEVLSGEKARRETNPVTLAHAIATQSPPDLRNAWPDAPPAAADLLVRAMARQPADRPRSAGELVGRLRSALAPRVTASGAPPRAGAAAAGAGPTRRHRVAAAPAAAAVAAGLPRRQPAEGRRAAGDAPGARSRQEDHGPPAGALTAGRKRPSRIGPLIAALLAVVAAVVVLAVILNSGGAGARHGSAAAAHRHTAPRRPTTAHSASTTSTTVASTAAPAAAPPASTTTSSTSSAASAPPAAGSPVGAVEAFYAAAAAHRYPAAWALADPTLRAELEGYRSFQEGQAGDRSITFDGARVISRSGSAATVAIQTTSVRDNGTHHCAGTVDLASAAGRWRLHLVHINCTG